MTLGYLISWEVAFVKLYKISSFKSILFKKKTFDNICLERQRHVFRLNELAEKLWIRLSTKQMKKKKVDEDDTPLEPPHGKTMGLGGVRIWHQRRTSTLWVVTTTHNLEMAWIPTFLLILNGMTGRTCECIGFSKEMWTGQIQWRCLFQMWMWIGCPIRNMAYGRRWAIRFFETHARMLERIY